MKSDEKYKLSKYLVKINRKDETAIYHSIFGNLCLVDNLAFDLLNSFQSPKKIQAVIKKYKTQELKNKANEIINNFLKKGFLLKDKKNELYEFKRYIKKRNETLETGKEASIIQLVVANTCNFNCKYCFVDSMYSSKEREKTQKDPKNQIMKKDDAERYIEIVIKHIKKNGENSLFIQFFGGEPLINWPLIKYVLDKFSNGKKHGIIIQYSIVTNGSLITEKIAKYFKKYDVNCIVSIDSLHEKERVLANGKNSISVITDNIKILNKYKNRIALHTAMTTSTFKYYSEKFDYNKDLIDFSIENGVKEIGIIFDFSFEFYKKYAISEIIKRFWKFYKYGKEKNINFTGYWNETFEIILKDRHYKDSGYKTCYATGALLSIEPSGVVYACKGSSAYFGNMDNFQEIFSSKNYLEYAKHSFNRREYCRGCEIENFCSNICPGSREKNYHTISKMHKPTCILYKKLMKKLIKNLRKEEVEFLKLEN